MRNNEKRRVRYLSSSATTLSGALEYGIDESTKGYIEGLISILDDEEYYGDVPPAPGVGIGLRHIGPFRDTGVDTFLDISGGATFA